MKLYETTPEIKPGTYVIHKFSLPGLYRCTIETIKLYTIIQLLKDLYILIVQETYPNTPPVWFADSEDPIVTNAVQILTHTQGRDNHVINQVNYLYFT